MLLLEHPPPQRVVMMSVESECQLKDETFVSVAVINILEARPYLGGVVMDAGCPGLGHEARRILRAV